MISGLLSLAGAAILVVIDQLIKHWATAALLPVGSIVNRTRKSGLSVKAMP